MIKRILVPLDGSTLAERAIPVSAHIARAARSSILFLRMISTASEFGMYLSEPSVLMQEAIEEDLARSTDYLEQVVQLEALYGIETDVGIFTGSAAFKIIDTARTQQVDLIVLCSHGEIGIRRWVMGGIAHKVVRHSPVPVLVLRDDGDKSLRLDHESQQPLHALVTLDGSLLSETVLEPVLQVIAQLAPSGPVHLHLLRVMDVPNRYVGWHSQAHLDNTLLEQALQHAEIYMRMVAERLQTGVVGLAALTITTSVKCEVNVAETIVRVAQHGEVSEERVGGYDLIAMATHGRGGIPRWAMGSVTESVLDGCTLPLLVVRPSERYSDQIQS